MSDQFYHRLLAEWRKHDGIIIGCDFDDTIFPYRFNQHSDLSRYAKTISLLKSCIDYGCKVIIFTARKEEMYHEITQFCSWVGLKIEGININLPGLKYGNEKKIYANIFLDDRAGLEESIERLDKALCIIKEEKERKLIDQWLRSSRETLLPLVKNLAGKTVGMELHPVVPSSEPGIFKIDVIHGSQSEWPTLDRSIRPKFHHWLCDHVLGRICVIDESNIDQWKSRSKHSKQPKEISIQIGDEVFAWDSGGWLTLSGRRGFLILKDRKEVVSVILTAMS